MRLRVRALGFWALESGLCVPAHAAISCSPELGSQCLQRNVTVHKVLGSNEASAALLLLQCPHWSPDGTQGSQMGQYAPLEQPWAPAVPFLLA